MKIFRSILEPVRVDLTWEARWADVDKGLIYCWERGREISLEDPELAFKARSGELVELPFKGAFKPKPKANDESNGNNGGSAKARKFGTLFYLAMWQGLRGDDLLIDTQEEPRLICSITGVAVVFTGSIQKYGRA